MLASWMIIQCKLSLLAAPYLGYCDVNDAAYQATRRTILSPENPYFYQGKYAMVWKFMPLSLYLADCLSIKRLTNRDKAGEKFCW